ncbi:transporter substrate-binding domain-containing protein [Pelomonas sp. APW6]|uniref:Transporter substrate-binding domain-containing protein n=1 Tax=Roseateles subflavus TaxID=3053353 RepID=A0ABT7LCV8_9BURK|nr:transporter substrate-binding domain-containing protein [Pelomonas sp. APW6]MDL5030688.1 transporter substrate-binding domain-containing protein [Pelomonas sp. APW6]
MILRAVGRRAWLRVLLMGSALVAAAPLRAQGPVAPPTAASAASAGTGQSLLALSDPWCPFNCQPDSDRPGYVVEMLRDVFTPPTWRLSYRIVPWDRALQEVRDGQAALALVLTREQAQQHGLLIGRETVGEPIDCLYVSAGNPLRFSRASDLDSLRQVAVVSGYEYEHAFGEWLARPANRPKIVFTRGANPAEVNARNLARGRVDGVIETAAVMQLQIQQLRLQDRIREAGCQPASPVYVGFSPRLPQAARLVEQFDQGIVEMRHNRRLARLLARYGLQDWKPD